MNVIAFTPIVIPEIKFLNALYDYLKERGVNLYVVIFDVYEGHLKDLIFLKYYEK